MTMARLVWALAAQTALCGAGAGMGAAAHAEEAPAPSREAAPSADGVLVFRPGDFASSRPNTALDLISRLPGFSLDSGDDVRGFAGAGGNVLIDGQRPVIKTEGLQDFLARITVGQVERIELIRGGAPGIDMQGRSVIANIVRNKSESFTQVLQASDTVFLRSGKNLPRWSYQATRSSGDRQWELQFNRGTGFDDSSGGRNQRFTEFFDGRPTLVERAGAEGDGGSHTGRANYKGPLFGGKITLNALASQDDFKDEVQFASALTQSSFSGRSSNDRGEVSANYTRDLSPATSIEVLGLSKLARGEGRNIGEDESGDQLFTVNAEAGESIARGVLRHTRSPKLSFEGGGEVAFNFREQSIGLTVNGAAIPLPASSVRVEELRGEAFVQGTWRPSPKWTFETGVRVEQSTISQSGDTTLERSFVYPKPRASLTWSPSETNQIRLRVERQVGQLDFRQFVSNVSLNSGVLSAGNADLEPDKRTIYEAAFEKRFWSSGAAVLTLRHEDITDAADQKPFTVLVDANRDGVPDDANGDGVPDTRLVAGPGNIGEGTNDVLVFALTLPLDKLGVKRGELKISSEWRESEVTDPLTLQGRRISEQRPDDIQFEFRQDLPSRNLSYGFSWFDGWSEREFLLQEVEHLRLERFVESFVEYRPTPRLTLRGELNNFMPYTFLISREVYDGPRNTGALDFRETEQRNSPIQAFFRVRYQIG